MRVLVTGHRGYIGSVLVGVLKHARHDVVGLDSDLYAGCDFGRIRDDTPSFDMDVRDVEFTDLLSFDAVIHLAALPEYFEGCLDDSLTWDINAHAGLRLAECCKQANVPRFLLASSCAVYGDSSGAPQTEESTPRPLTAYAKAKLFLERELLGMSEGAFTPVILRNATVYGVSPRLRMDTAVNDFVGSAVTRGRVEPRSDGRAWRPFIHVEDLARAYAGILAAPDEIVGGRTFNVAVTEENYRIVDVADLVAELTPSCTRFTMPTTPDRRSYHVDGARLRDALPNLRWRWTLPQGIRQLRAAMIGAGLSQGDWRCDRYRRLLHLQSRLERGDVQPSLRPLDVGSRAVICSP